MHLWACVLAQVTTLGRSEQPLLLDQIEPTFLHIMQRFAAGHCKCIAGTSPFAASKTPGLHPRQIPQGANLPNRQQGRRVLWECRRSRLWCPHLMKIQDFVALHGRASTTLNRKVHKPHKVKALSSYPCFNMHAPALCMSLSCAQHTQCLCNVPSIMHLPCHDT